MPKYKVCLQQYIEKTAIVEVEADTPTDAVCRARRVESVNAKWEDGEDASDVRAYAVMDKDGELVWEDA